METDLPRVDQDHTRSYSTSRPRKQFIHSMRKLSKQILLVGIAAFGFLFGVGSFLVANAGPITPTTGGGTGTNIVPASGTIPIGNGLGTYTPALLTPGTNVTIVNASGSVTINSSGGGGSSTTFNGITTSTLSIQPGVGATVTTSTDASGKAIITIGATGNGSSTVITCGAGLTCTPSNPITTTGTITLVTSGNWTGTWQLNNPSDFLSSSTVVNNPSTTIPTIYVSTVNGVSGVITNVAKTNVDNNFTAGQTVNGNVTTTNETVSSTLQLTDVTPSGTVTYPLSVDGSSFLNLGPVTGNSPGSGAVSTQEYNIVEQNCPNNASTSNQSECDWSMSTVYPDGNRVFTDLNQESYPGFNSTGWFETATGASSTGKAFLYPYDLEMSNYPVATSTISHHLILTAVPVNATGTWAGVNWTQTGNSVLVGTDEITNSLMVDANGANITGNSMVIGNFIASSTGNSYISSNRAGTAYISTIALSNGGTDEWDWQMQGNGTNGMILVDPNNGGDILQAVQNGTTTIGVSGTGKSVVLGVAAIASTTLTVNQTSTLLAKLSVGTSSDPGKATLLVNGQAKFPMPVLATATTASTIVDFSVSERQMLTLGAATTTIYVTNTEPGDTDLLKLCQDGTGSRTATFMASSTNTTSTIQWGLAGLPTLSTTTYYCDDFSFVTSPQARNIASSVVEGLYGLNQFAY